MYKILTLNTIQAVGLARLPSTRYTVDTDLSDPDVVLLRSFNMHEWPIPATLKAVGRAGSGVNNIPVTKLTGMGIPVFNTPGANANAVKELVLAGMLLAARHIGPAWDFARHLVGDDKSINEQVEAGKKRFVGIELPNRILGVIGLGAIGVKIANAAIALGMRVKGYDPHITVSNAWQLAAQVEQVNSVNEILAQSDFVTLHIPLNDETHHLVDAKRLATAKPGITILNFARAAIVDEVAICEAMDTAKVRSYVCDFPSNRLKNHPRVITLPHLGASTEEAEENCAIMIADQVRDYLEQGTIHNSVNFPEMAVTRDPKTTRLIIVNANIPGMIERISAVVAKAELNICDMLNKSRGEIACTLVDVEGPMTPEVADSIARSEGVLAVRVI